MRTAVSMPVTRSQTLSKDKDMSAASAIDAASGDSSPEVRKRYSKPNKQQNKDVSTINAHPRAKAVTPDSKAQYKEKKAVSKQSQYSSLWKVFVAAPVLVVIFVGASYWVREGMKGSRKPSMRNSNVADIVEENISSIRKNFPGQEEDLWVTVKAAVDYHISSEAEPECPIILLFGSHPDASKTSRCLVEKLGRTLSEILGKENPHDSLYEIDGEDFQNQNADRAKMDMDRGLRKAFQGKPGKKVAIVFNLDYLPPCSVLLFHGYCDTDNAIFKDVAMIFTVTLDDRSPRPNSPKDWEPLVMEHLKKMWVDKCPSLPLEKVQAFLSRITNNVVLVKREEPTKC
ncbi:torsin-1A-interacting protein 1-like [Asterias amurensis]|uniref:torsin-1A-interacting protein 1-like n=1 Tax=Asterias amurensis TaxID=7602 RepID=UPI003AB809EB